MLTALPAVSGYSSNQEIRPDRLDYLINPEVYRRVAVNPSEWKKKSIIEGSFGKLELVPMSIQPPLEYLELGYKDFAANRSDNLYWRFKGHTRETTKELMREWGCSDSFVDQAMALAVDNPDFNGIDIQLSFEIYRSLDKNVRIRGLRHLLKLNGRNPDEICRIYLWGNFLEWTKRSKLKPATLALISEFVYEHGDAVFFYDAQTIYNQLKDPEEKIRYIQLVSRYSALNVYLKTNALTDENLETIIAYWGVNARRTRVEQILESSLNNPNLEQIDVTLLLPPFARARINLYLDDFARKTMERFSRDCIWTALNFFNDYPDERFGTDDEGPDLMNAAFMEIPEPTRLGDIILLVGENNNIIHACVHVAGPVVFTKNGSSDLVPFVLTYRNDVETIYRARGAVGNKYLRIRHPGPTQQMRRMESK